MRGGGSLLRSPARHGEEFRRVVDEMLTHLRHLRVVFEVVVAIGQCQATLIDISNDFAGVMQVGIGIEVKQRIWPVHMHVGDRFDQDTLVFCSVHAVEIGLQRSCAFGVGCLFVDASTVEVANLLVDGAVSRAGCSSLFQDVVQRD